MELEALHPAGPEGRSGALKFLLEKTRETVIFGPSFTETVKKKKKGGFP